MIFVKFLAKKISESTEHSLTFTRLWPERRRGGGGEHNKTNNITQQLAWYYVESISSLSVSMGHMGSTSNQIHSTLPRLLQSQPVLTRCLSDIKL